MLALIVRIMRCKLCLFAQSRPQQFLFSYLFECDAPAPLVLGLDFAEYVPTHTPTASLTQAKPELGTVDALEPNCPIAAVFLDLEDGDLETVQGDQGLHQERVWLQKVEVVVEATRVDRWEDEVCGLDHDEAESVVEHPARVQKHVLNDLREPEEAEDENGVEVLGHDARTENDQGEGDEENRCDDVRLM